MIKKVTMCKFLGVYINNKLDWKDHMKHVKNQISKSIGSINSMKAILPHKILKMLYFAIVQPYLVYCIPVWGSQHTTPEFKDIFIAQKRAIRTITNSTQKVNSRFQHTKNLFRTTNILTVHNLYYYITSNESKKILCTKKPQLIYDFYILSERSSRLIIPKYNYSKISNRSFIFNSSKIINYMLTNGIEYSSNSQYTFKTIVKGHLLFKQSQPINFEPDWLPCNINIFSDINIS